MQRNLRPDDEPLDDATGGVGAVDPAISVLVVGEVAAWAAGGAVLPRADRIRFAEFSEVSGELLARIEPTVVLSSVLTPVFDAFDLAVLLSNLGFRGRYRALTPTLPDPGIVRREVRNSAPGLDFDLLVVDGAPLPR